MKYALSVGINNYPNPNHKLNGCLNDVDDWCYIFNDLLKFDLITKLKDKDATLFNVTSILNKIIGELKAGDLFVFQYSGHGTLMQDLNYDEYDEVDEAMCLYDKLLIDDQLAYIIKNVPKEANMVIISDSCHSGTLTREWNNNLKAIKFIVNYNLHPNCIHKRSLFNFFKDRESENIILLSACESDEVSFDSFFEKYNGAYTYFATKILRENTQITYDEFYKKIREKLPNKEYNQTPQIECSKKNKNKIIFT